MSMNKTFFPSTYCVSRSTVNIKSGKNGFDTTPENSCFDPGPHASTDSARMVMEEPLRSWPNGAALLKGSILELSISASGSCTRLKSTGPGKDAHDHVGAIYDSSSAGGGSFGLPSGR